MRVVSPDADPGVAHVGGALDSLFEAALDPRWVLRDDGFDPLLERDRESRLSIGNGLLGTRASLDLPARASMPRTYLAGIYDAATGLPGSVSLVPMPDWTRLVVSADGHELRISKSQAHLRVLDMATGSLHGDELHRLPSGTNIRLRTLRLLSQHDRRIALQAVRLIADGRAEITFAAHLVPTSLGLILEDTDGGVVSLWRTRSGSRVRIAMVAQLWVPEGPAAAEMERPLARRWKWQAQPGETATMIRAVTFTRLNGTRLNAAGGRSRERLPRADRARQIVTSSSAAWAERWRAADINVEGDEQAGQALHYAAYQLLSAANPEDERTSVGARGLTGDVYSGHVFWDTEIFLLPFYMLCWPEAARAMLMYRYHTLPAARAKAARLGYRGALYAWESADNGDETTPASMELPNGETVPVLSGLIEHHISADIAFAVQRYWEATGDDRFMAEAGAEILLDTARFWASRVELEADGLYHIRDVVGPDEYHEHVDDNAYTNWMARWNLDAALNAAQRLESREPARWSELRSALGLSDEELATWREISSRMYTGFDPISGLLEQFKGFFDLEPIDLQAYEPRNMPIDVLLGRERTQRSQAIKQADVLMLIALLWERFAPEARAANFRYYEPRCAHGSSLSPGVHALVAARLGDLHMAETYFRETMLIDLGDSMGNLAGGVHIAALGSLWQAAVFGFAGLSLQGEVVGFEPRLPRRWKSLSFTLRWRQTLLRMFMSRPAVRATVVEGPPLTVAVNGDAREIPSGGEHSWRLPRSSVGRRSRRVHG